MAASTKALPSSIHDPPGAESLSTEEQIDRFRIEFLEEQLQRACPNKVAAIKRAVEEAVKKQKAQPNNGLLMAADKVQNAIQEAERAIAGICASNNSEAPRDENVSSKVKALGNIVAKAAVGGHDLQEMLDEQGAKADAVAAVAPLHELAKSSATSEEQEFKDERAPEAAAHAQQRAAQSREAQQRELAQRTGDVLYPSVGTEEPEAPQPGDSSWNSKPAEF